MAVISIQALNKTLDSAREIEITVTGRKSGRNITLPVWFVKQGRKLLLLPVRGSETNWYMNVQHTPKIGISSGENKITLNALPADDEAMVRDAVEKFRAKYGAGDVKRYYPKLDVCVEINLP